MTKVRIVSGGYGAHENGRVKLYRRGQEAEVSQEEAERLVKLGVAEFVKEPVLMAETPAAGDTEEAPGDTPETEANHAGGIDSPDGEAASMTEEELKALPFSELKKLAADFDLPVGKLKSRDNITKALLEAQVSEDEEELPFLDAEAPVV